MLTQVILAHSRGLIFLAKPLILLVPVERIELPTFGLQIGGRTLTAANVG
jgi:hypothetical protein